MKKLVYKVLQNYDFHIEDNFLEVILSTAGVTNIKEFLNVNESHTHDPFLLKNMKEGVKLLHENIGEDKKVYIQVDSDTDGYTSSAYIYQFIKDVAPKTEIVYGFHFKKEHGVFYEEVKDINDLDLIIVPDAGSDSFQDLKNIKEKMKVPVLIIDHHEIGVKYADKENKKNPYTVERYTTLINCKDNQYPNPNLSGVGVVHKFCLAYCEAYGINKSICNKYLDLVSLGQIADSMDMRDLETRYYTLEGLKEKNMSNLFIKEIAERFAEDMKLGHTITSYGWVIAPKINGCIRYGKEDEQIDLFRAFIGETEDREYQPRRKNKNDPKPEIEIHSLQKTMARVASNAKQRQDSDARKFMKEINKQIIDEGLDKDSVIIVNGSDILEDSTIGGLVANKLLDEYKRPILILKEVQDKDDCYGGSVRAYDGGVTANFQNFLRKLNLFEHLGGHQSAFGFRVKKDNVELVRKKCNELIKLKDLTVIHEVDYEVKADKLTNRNIAEVADAHAIWGNGVPEPTFAITDINIVADDIKAYGQNNGFIRFKYKDVDYIKKYCKKTDWDEMTLRDRRTLGRNMKQLKLTIIGNFVWNEWEGVRYPQVRIKHFYSEEQKVLVKNTKVAKTTKAKDINIDDIF